MNFVELVLDKPTFLWLHSIQPIHYTQEELFDIIFVAIVLWALIWLLLYCLFAEAHLFWSWSQYFLFHYAAIFCCEMFSDYR